MSSKWLPLGSSQPKVWRSITWMSSSFRTSTVLQRSRRLCFQFCYSNLWYDVGYYRGYNNMYEAYVSRMLVCWWMWVEEQAVLVEGDGNWWSAVEFAAGHFHFYNYNYYYDGCYDYYYHHYGCYYHEGNYYDYYYNDGTEFRRRRRGICVSAMASPTIQDWRITKQWTYLVSKFALFNALRYLFHFCLLNLIIETHGYLCFKSSSFSLYASPRRRLAATTSSSYLLQLKRHRRCKGIGYHTLLRKYVRGFILWKLQRVL